MTQFDAYDKYESGVLFDLDFHINEGNYLDYCNSLRGKTIDTEQLKAKKKNFNGLFQWFSQKIIKNCFCLVFAPSCCVG